MSVHARATVADYKLLGVPVGAQPDDVRQRFRKLAMASHPDKNPGAAARFIAVKAAYERITEYPLAPVVVAAAARPHPPPAPRSKVVEKRPLARTTPKTLDDMTAGDAVWISADNMHVGLDLRCYLDPLARVHPHEMPHAQIQIEARAGGYTVTVPAWGRLRWKAEDHPTGVAAAAVRASAHADRSTSDRISATLVSTTLHSAPDGDVYVSGDALLVNASGVYLDLDATWVAHPSPRAPVKVTRSGDSRHVRAEGAPDKWAQRNHQIGPNRIKARTARLGSVRIDAQPVQSR